MPKSNTKTEELKFISHLTNDIELLSLRSERLEMEYTSLLRALEQQQALLTKLSSE